MSSAGDEPWIDYYDADYPALLEAAPGDGFDEAAAQMGLHRDVACYRAIAADIGGPILDLCCGTGRLTLPLARDGHRVTALDISTGMLAQLEARLAREDPEVQARVEICAQDAQHPSLSRHDFQLAIIAFNSLPCIPAFEGQRATLRAAAAHLAPGGYLALDVQNPLRMDLAGRPTPALSFTRRNPRTGNLYSRFSRMSRPDAEQRVRVDGWYDEVEPDGRLRRRHFLLHMRLIFPGELERMLDQAGLELVRTEGCFDAWPYGASSSRLLFLSRVRSSPR